MWGEVNSMQEGIAANNEKCCGRFLNCMGSINLTMMVDKVQRFRIKGDSLQTQVAGIGQREQESMYLQHPSVEDHVPASQKHKFWVFWLCFFLHLFLWERLLVYTIRIIHFYLWQLKLEIKYNFFWRVCMIYIMNQNSTNLSFLENLHFKIALEPPLVGYCIFISPQAWKKKGKKKKEIFPNCLSEWIWNWKETFFLCIFFFFSSIFLEPNIDWIL